MGEKKNACGVRTEVEDRVAEQPSSRSVRIRVLWGAGGKHVYDETALIKVLEVIHRHKYREGLLIE